MNTPHFFRIGLSMLLLAAAGCLSLPEQAPIQAEPLQFGADEWRVTEHVIVITDASGTMWAERTFPNAKALTRSFVAAMPEAGAPAERAGGYAAGSVGFGGDERNAAPLAPFDRAGLAAKAASLEIMGDVSGTGGTTPLDAVIREAAASLEGRSGQAALVVFSDGLPNCEVSTLSAAEALIASRADPVCIHTVQSGTDPAGSAFLKRVSELTRCGSLRHEDDVTTAHEVQQLARAVFVGPAPLPAVAAAADPCAGAVRLRGVEFGFDQDQVTEESKPVLDVAVERLAACPEIRVTVSGHTDAMGSEAYNNDLSYRRAKAARDYFVEGGIPASRLDVEGFGESLPIAPNDSAEGRARNRRVELSPAR
jgi:OOP family OmpA-OmpF porin